MRSEKYIQQGILEIRAKYMESMQEADAWLDGIESVFLPQSRREQIINVVCNMLKSDRSDTYPPPLRRQLPGLTDMPY